MGRNVDKELKEVKEQLLKPAEKEDKHQNEARKNHRRTQRRNH